MAHGFGVVTMRARADLRRRWPTFLVLALLVGGLAAGVMAAAAGARRTASAYPRLLAASNSVDVILPRDESTRVQADLGRPGGVRGGGHRRVVRSVLPREGRRVAG